MGHYAHIRVSSSKPRETQAAYLSEQGVIPNSQQGIHSWNLFCFYICLFLAWTSLAKRNTAFNSSLLYRGVKSRDDASTRQIDGITCLFLCCAWLWFGPGWHRTLRCSFRCRMIVFVHNVLTRCYVQRYRPIFYAGLSSAVSRLVLLPLFTDDQGGFLLADEMGKVFDIERVPQANSMWLLITFPRYWTLRLFLTLLSIRASYASSSRTVTA